MTSIHPSAVVSPQAEIGSEVSIGPFAVVEKNVQIGDGCTVAARVVIKDGTTLGTKNQIEEGAVIGGKPQHLRANGKLGETIIGNENLIRENVTIHRALAEGEATRIGNQNLVMVSAHVAHDCVLGNNTILANNVLLAGHIHVADRAYLSGAVAVHQFCRIGRCAMVGGQAHVSQDVPPFVTVDGLSSRVVGLNLVGLKRAGYSNDEIRELKQAYRVIYRNGTKWDDTLSELRKQFQNGPAAEFHDFLTDGQRGFVQERRTPQRATVPFTGRSDESKSGEIRRAG